MGSPWLPQHDTAQAGLPVPNSAESPVLQGGDIDRAKLALCYHLQGVPGTRMWINLSQQSNQFMGMASLREGETVGFSSS
jgi:hypothetical protein